MTPPKHEAPPERPLIGTGAAIVLAFALVIVAFIVVGKDEYAYNLSATGLVIGVGLLIWALRRR